MTLACSAPLAERVAASRTAYSGPTATLRPRRLVLGSADEAERRHWFDFAVKGSFGCSGRSPSFLSLPSLSGNATGQTGIGPPICTGAGGADVGARRHGGDMRGIEDGRSPALRPHGLRRCNIADHGNRRGEHICDDLRACWC